MQEIQTIILGAFKDWWWVLLPLILWRPFKSLWLWWRMENFSKKQKLVMLEIKMPREVLKPLKAMEQVFSSLWGNVYDPSDWWEKWIEGKYLLNYSFETVSIGGESHFFIRIPESRRNGVEASIYSQYPDSEISVVEDYVKYTPNNIPNKEWELWGTDYQLIREDVYPIKTYPKFFEEKPDQPMEEKRLDPMATLLEGMAKLKPGEQLWVQIIAKPITPAEYDYEKIGREFADKLAKRPTKKLKGPRLLLIDALYVLVTGKPIEVEAEKEDKGKMIYPEMTMTPGEKEVLSGIESKTGRRVFMCNIRFIYLAKRDVYDGGAKAIPFGHFNQFATINLNALKPWPKTITKVHKHWFLFWNLFYARRLYIKKRRLFRYYVSRWTPLFPRPGGTFILDIEELATLFHFPGRMVASAPFVSRVEAKKGEAPPGLPVEE